MQVGSARRGSSKCNEPMQSSKIKKKNKKHSNETLICLLKLKLSCLFLEIGLLSADAYNRRGRTGEVPSIVRPCVGRDAPGPVTQCAPAAAHRRGARTSQCPGDNASLCQPRCAPPVSLPVMQAIHSQSIPDMSGVARIRGVLGAGAELARLLLSRAVSD